MKRKTDTASLTITFVPSTATYDAPAPAAGYDPYAGYQQQPAAAPAPGGYGGGYGEPAAAPAYGGGGGGYDAGGRGGGGRGRGGPPPPKEQREGDWTCDSCGNTNFSHRCLMRNLMGKLLTLA